MAKKKSNLGGLIMKVVSAGLAVLSFVALAFTWYGVSGKAGNVSSSSSGSYAEWLDFIESCNTLKVDGIGGWNFAKVMLIIALVCAGVLALAMVAKIFMDNGLVSLVVKLASFATIATFAIFAVAFVIGCFGLSSSNDTLKTSITYLPHLGSSLLAIFGIGAGVTGMLASRK